MKSKRIVFKICMLFLMVVLGLMSVQAACAGPEEAAPTTPAPATPAAGVKWCEELWGQPKYGGTLTIATDRLGDAWDPYFPFNANWWTLEHLFMSDMSTDRNVWSYKVSGTSPDYVGLLAESWEWEGPQTLIVHLRQNVKWQDKQPTYGREFTADDVVYHYDRLLGTGSGFTEPNPITRMFVKPIVAVSARDKYTIAIDFEAPTPMANWWAATDAGSPNMMEAREFVESDVMDWHNVTGTGAYMVTDYVAGNSVTMSKNPDYYRYDERYPGNKLPYLDTLKIMGILDPSTQVAAIRSGQVDMVFNLESQVAQNLQKTNPELILTARPYNGFAIDLRCHKAPFNDIRVRKALQLAVDVPTIAKTHYGGAVDGEPAGLVAKEYGDWAFTYKDWPADLQQEYSYNVEQAKAILAEAGYPDGFETNVYMPNEQDVDLMQIMKAYFAEIGVDMTIDVVDQNQLVALGPSIETMSYNEWTNMTYPVNMSIFNRTSLQPVNQVHASAEEVGPYEELYFQLMASPDEATAIDLARKAQEYALRQHWAIHTTGRVYYDAVRPRVKGFAGEDAQGWSRVWFWTGFWVDDGK